MANDSSATSAVVLFVSRSEGHGFEDFFANSAFSGTGPVLPLVDEVSVLLVCVLGCNAVLVSNDAVLNYENRSFNSTVGIGAIQGPNGSLHSTPHVDTALNQLKTTREVKTKLHLIK